MGASDLWQLGSQFGSAGLFVAYLVYRDTCDRRERRERAQARDELDKAEVSSRERLASSLTALSMVIQGRANV